MIDTDYTVMGPIGALHPGDEYSNQSILKFSEAVGVSPGIVVGRLQHEDFLEPYQGNKLKQIVNIGIH